MLEKEIKEQAEKLLINAQGENKLEQTEEQLAAAKSRHADILQSKDEEIQSLQGKMEVQYYINTVMYDAKYLFLDFSSWFDGKGARDERHNHNHEQKVSRE